MIKRKVAAIILMAAFMFLAIVPETLACHRSRRDRFRAVAGRTYYNPNYGYARQSYYPNYSFARRSYNPNYSFARRSGRDSLRRTVLTVAAPAAIGAGVGALLSGKKGAAVGALLGGGGGAAYHLLRNRRNRY